ncbi:MAG: response regulator [Candidatus Wallbacteria bacterium]|nr:response regulator [Candidatus Wallbacteria bacterium]
MPKKILVCDDDLDFARLIMAKLKSEGYEVVIAADSIQSVALAHKEKPDLILLDIKMPAGGVYTVHEKLRLSSATMSIPVILVSALPFETVREHAAQLGVSDFQIKPCQPEEIIKKIEKLI